VGVDLLEFVIAGFGADLGGGRCTVKRGMKRWCGSRVRDYRILRGGDSTLMVL
jgi:hypothetical protein